MAKITVDDWHAIELNQSIPFERYRIDNDIGNEYYLRDVYMTRIKMDSKIWREYFFDYL